MMDESSGSFQLCGQYESISSRLFMILAKGFCPDFLFLSFPLFLNCRFEKSHQDRKVRKLMSGRVEMTPIVITPQALQLRDTIAFVSPSSRLNRVFPHRVYRAKDALEKLGYRVKVLHPFYLVSRHDQNCLSSTIFSISHCSCLSQSDLSLNSMCVND